MTSLRLNPGYRCTCHHRGRWCSVMCSNTATAIRGTDGRPVCGDCVVCDPADSAGFGFPASAITEVVA